jgi:hypothetical protein
LLVSTLPNGVSTFTEPEAVREVSRVPHRDHPIVEERKVPNPADEETCAVNEEGRVGEERGHE